MSTWTFHVSPREPYPERGEHNFRVAILPREDADHQKRREHSEGRRVGGPGRGPSRQRGAGRQERRDQQCFAKEIRATDGLDDSRDRVLQWTTKIGEIADGQFAAKHLDRAREVVEVVVVEPKGEEPHKKRGDEHDGDVSV